MSTINKPTVYRIDMTKAPQHFRAVNSWYTPSPAERRVITGDSHDDYVHTEVLNDYVGGSVPRLLLIATDEDADEIVKRYEQEIGHEYPSARRAILDAVDYERAKQDAQGKLDLPI